MAQTSAGRGPIPPAKKEDPEDVAWALSTAEAMYARGDRGEALKWLRRAAEAAAENQTDDRALQLAKAAADLSAALGTSTSAPAPPARSSSARPVAPAVPPAPVQPPKPPSPPARPSVSPPDSPPRSGLPPTPQRVDASGSFRRAAPVSVRPKAERPSEPTLQRDVPTREPRPLAPTPVVDEPTPVAPGATAPAAPPAPPTPPSSPGSSPTSSAPLPATRDANPNPPTSRTPSVRPPSRGSAPVISRGPEVSVPDLLDDDLEDGPEEKTRIGVPAYQSDAMAATETAPPVVKKPEDPALRPSQAMRVIVWRAADGVHVAPHGTHVSAISVDALLVALDPTADLAAWLSKK